LDSQFDQAPNISIAYDVNETKDYYLSELPKCQTNRPLQNPIILKKQFISKIKLH